MDGPEWKAAIQHEWSGAAHLSAGKIREGKFNALEIGPEPYLVEVRQGMHPAPGVQAEIQVEQARAFQVAVGVEPGGGKTKANLQGPELQGGVEVHTALGVEGQVGARLSIAYHEAITRGCQRVAPREPGGIGFNIPCGINGGFLGAKPEWKQTSTFA